MNITGRTCPVISIIMPTYNASRYVRDAIESVFAQTFQDWELVLINDGSTDNSLDIANEYANQDDRIRIINNPRNLGLLDTKNIGVNAAVGRYIFPLDPDDMLAPECLEKVHNIITTTDYAVVCPNGHFFGEQSGVFDFPKPTRYNMYRCTNGIHNSSIYEKKYWEKYGGYDKNFSKGYEDFDFWLNFLDDGKKVIRIDDELFFYRIKPKENSRNEECRQHHKLLFKKLRRKHWRINMYDLFHIIYKDIILPRTGIRKIKVFKITVYRKRITE
ncbi:MAG: glycosyltransferase [Alphaproteobacteria bacterium]|nr:glycosyltransferase [Alphaproteobacteria bacterium]